MQKWKKHTLIPNLFMFDIFLLYIFPSLPQPIDFTKIEFRKKKIIIAKCARIKICIAISVRVPSTQCCTQTLFSAFYASNQWRLERSIDAERTQGNIEHNYATAATTTTASLV